MRHITIIGAGQAGLQLGIGLLDHGYTVMLVSERTPEAIGQGAILSTQCMFGSSRVHERALGLNLWDGSCPPVEALHLRVAGPDGTPALQFQTRLDEIAQSIDQRLKIPAWMNEFRQRGSELVIAEAGITELEAYARTSDLVVVATGKGELGALFPRDDTRSPYRQPQRVLAASCVRGYRPDRPYDGVCATLIPGAGEYFVMPGLTTSGPCHFMVVEAIPGGPLDCWNDVTHTDQHIERLQEVLGRWLPWESERAQQMEPTDARASLRGRFAPTVRHPVGTLPSGATVLGLADTVVLNDPVTGQGANNAAKAAAIYAASIVARATQPFDTAWMQATFDAAWNDIQWATYWTNAMLQSPPPHVLALLGAAAAQPRVARWFAHGFDNPATLFPYLADPIAAEQLIDADTYAEAAVAA